MNGVLKLVKKMKFIDIGANLTDPVFQGRYNGTQKHQSDLDIVLNRGWSIGLEKIIITAGSNKEANDALKMVKMDDRLYATVGCHPTRCNEFKSNPNQYYSNLYEKIENNLDKIVAIGEFGLDYDRLQFCDKNTQIEYFDKQFNLVEKFQLPMFLHCRSAHDDFIKIIEKNSHRLPSKKGVVHSFTGTINEANKLIDLGFFIGLNGCSLKNENSLNVVKEIPLNKILLETDCPWCSIRPSHASSKYVKTKFPTVKKKENWSSDKLIDGRCEPCHIIQVAEVIAEIKNQSVEQLANICYENTMQLFFKN